MPDSRAISYNLNTFRAEMSELLSAIPADADLEEARDRLCDRVRKLYEDVCDRDSSFRSLKHVRSMDCCRAFLNVLHRRSDKLTGFSVCRAMLDIASNRPRDELRPGFFAELVNWAKGLKGQAAIGYLSESAREEALTGREAAVERSDELDRLWSAIKPFSSHFTDGLTRQASERRLARKQQILNFLGGSEDDWLNWHWHCRKVITDTEQLDKLLTLSAAEKAVIQRAREGRLPFGITPYYLSLMDSGDDHSRDRALRAQVIPSGYYVSRMLKHREDRKHSCDFMLERDTSPTEHIVRRYPAVTILKACNTCPQICVYCQRNWEIEEAMSRRGFTDSNAIHTSIDWIRRHEAIHEVLVTGGDPFILGDKRLEIIMKDLAAIPHVSVIRIGTRTLVTLPMRITPELASMLGSFRQVGVRDVAVVTHIEHPYEVTMDTAQAVDLLRREGIGVYNQQVYTFYVSRRFETAYLRMLLRRIGIDPYYTFVPKGKEEIKDYRVPIARLLQEQKEEARLLPGLCRTDEVVYNIPGLGKNYIRAGQHRNLLTVLPDGSRIYEFHPWEKNVTKCSTFLATDVPILDYLHRLSQIGEDPQDYSSIWFYF